jgi:hypothetical protein
LTHCRRLRLRTTTRVPSNLAQKAHCPELSTHPIISRRDGRSEKSKSLQLPTQRYNYRNYVSMSETTGPRFQLICEHSDCMFGYCFEDAKYWAIWDGRLTVTRVTFTTKRAVCGTHRDAIEGKAWNEVSEDFRTNW